MRAFVMLTFGLAVALAPASALGAEPPATPTPGYQQTQRRQAAPAAPARAEGAVYDARRHAARADQARFRRPSSKRWWASCRAGFAKTTDETLKKQAAGFKVYKAQEPFGSNTLYVVQLDPTSRAATTTCSRCCRRR